MQQVYLIINWLAKEAASLKRNLDLLSPGGSGGGGGGGENPKFSG